MRVSKVYPCPVRIYVVRDGVEVEVVIEDGIVGRARMTDDERTDVCLSLAEQVEALEAQVMWYGRL